MFTNTNVAMKVHVLNENEKQNHNMSQKSMQDKVKIVQSYLDIKEKKSGQF